MRVAVTGGSGIVGGAVVRHLVEAGHEVVGLTRSAQAEKALQGLGAATVTGDVLDPDSVRAVIAGAEWVFHVAGVNEMCSPNPEVMDRVNVEGTRIVCEAIRRSEGARLIHTSSAVTIGEIEGTVGSETTTHRGYYHSRYERSKHRAEKLVREYAEDIDVVIVNPASVQGPGRATGTGKLILDLARGRLRIAVDTTFSVVDIDDCARGHLLAAHHGVTGRRYILSGFTMSVREAIESMRDLTGAPASPRIAPQWVAAAAGRVIGPAYRLAGRKAPICPEMVRVMRSGAAYDGSLATRELGLVYTGPDVTIARTIEWFRSRGLLV